MIRPNLIAVSLSIVGLTIASAAEDPISIDSRRELLADDELGTGNSFFINAYRLSSLVPGSLAMILSDHLVELLRSPFSC